jgi:hypothetical protein
MEVAGEQGKEGRDSPTGDGEDVRGWPECGDPLLLRRCVGEKGGAAGRKEQGGAPSRQAATRKE